MRLSQADKARMAEGVTKLDGEDDAGFERRKLNVIGLKLAVMYEEKIPTDKLRAVVCSAIVGWENMLDREGNEVKYRGGDKGGLEQGLRGLLHEKVLDDLAGRLEQLSGLGDVERLSFES